MFKWLINNPWLIATLAYILGIVLGLQFWVSLNFYLFFFIILCAIGGVVILKKYRSIVLLILTMMLSGMANVVLQVLAIKNQPLNDVVGLKNVQAYGTILTRPKLTDYQCSFLLKVQQVDGVPKDWGNLWVRVKLINPEQDACLTKLDIGKNIYVITQIKRTQPANNFFEFDAQRYFLSKDCGFEAFVVHPTLVKDVGSDKGFGTLINSSFEKVISAIEKNLSPIHSQLMISLIYGDRVISVNEEIAKTFRTAGLTHLLVVSGAQVGILAFILFTLLRPLGIPGIDGWRGLITSILMATILIFFCVLTGLDFSIKRSVFITILWLIARLLNRKIHPFTALAQSALIITIPNPLAVLSASFQLSYVATFSIIFGFYCIKRYESNYKKQIVPQSYVLKIVFFSLLSSASVSLLISPIIANSFGQIQIYAIIANLIALPLSGIILIWGIITNFSFLLMNPIISAPLKAVMVFWLDLLLAIAQGISQLPFATGNVEPPNWLVILIYYVGVFLLIEVYTNKTSSLILRNRMILCSFLALIVSFGLYFISCGQTRVVIPYTRSGDAVVVRYQQKLIGFVNCGNSSKYYSKAIRTLEKTANYLGFNKYTHIYYFNARSPDLLAQLQDISLQITSVDFSQGQLPTELGIIELFENSGWQLTPFRIKNLKIFYQPTATYVIYTSDRVLSVAVRKKHENNTSLGLSKTGALALRLTTNGRIIQLVTTKQKRII